MPTLTKHGLARTLIYVSPSLLITLQLGGINFSAFELMIVFLIFAFLSKPMPERPNKTTSSHKLVGYYRIIFLTFIVLHLPGLLFAPDSKLVLKEIIKWSEVFVISLTIIFLVTSTRNFRTIYIALFASVFILFARELFVAVFNDTGRVRVGVISVFLLSLSLPFLKLKYMKPIIFSIIILLLFTQSRSVWIAMIIVMYGYFWKVGTNQKIIFLVSILILSVAVLKFTEFGAIFVTRMGHLNIYDDSTVAFSTYQRIYRIQLAYFAFLENPIFGVGAGNLFEYLKISNSPNLSEWTNWLLVNDRKSAVTHNVFAQTGGELGFIGLSALLSLLWTVFRILNTKSCVPDSPRDNWVWGLQLSFWVFLGFLAFSYVAGTDRIIVGLYLGLIISTPEYLRKRLQIE